jgi:uncharacterized membrane protein YdjX (TVP38/TMEM64 family)
VRPRLLILLGIGLFIGLLLVGREAAALIPRFALWVESLGTLGIAVFVIGYIIAAIALVPGSLLTLAGGAIFGLGRGVAIVFVAATLGAAAAFLVSRYAARGVIERRLAVRSAAAAPGAAMPRSSLNAMLGAIDAATARHGLLVVLLLRLSPLIPFNVLNYALGLTRVRFAHFVIASIGMLPATFLYVYYGRVAGDIAAVAAGMAQPRGTGYWLLLGLGLLATFAVTALLARVAQRALQERLPG